jgi:DNA-binding MarR family transcriptional regulator
MPLRDRLNKDILRLLYEGTELGKNIQAIAENLNVEWGTTQKVIDELAKMGYVKTYKTNIFPFKITVTLTEEGKKLAFELFSTDQSKLGLAEELLLLILLVADGEIKGTTKLEKLPFLLEKDFGVKLHELFKYFPYRFGPYSQDVIKSANILYNDGFILITEKILDIIGDEERIMRIYTLTPKGKELAKRLFQKIPDKLQKRLVKLRIPASKTTKELVDYVHIKYPEFKK